MKKYKKWIFFSLIIIISIMSIISIINYLANPLWCFNHNFEISKYKNQYNEREQKTNLLYFGKNDYNATLIGSSRSSFINTNHSEKYNLFNYSIASLHIKEYKGYIDIAKKINPDSTKTIILGLDFFSYLKDSNIAKSPKEFYSDITAPFYRFKTLLSYDSLRKAKKNINIKNDTKERVYTYEYSVYTTKRNSIETKKNMPNKIENFTKRFYNAQGYYKEYKNILNNIKYSYPESNFIIFTTPITKDLFVELKKHNLYDEYENWIKDLVSVFGKIHHFMYLNEITNNSYKNFYDGHHAYQDIATLILKQIENKNNKDFGMMITQKNVNNILTKLKKINQF
ncbi:MAG TPA: hypothetical protein EYG73_07175 [Arcobacter sp.]|nr:hypothetical protein [Arcobacter sp.]